MRNETRPSNGRASTDPDARLDRFETALERALERIEELETRTSQLETILETTTERLEAKTDRIEELEATLERHEQRLDELDADHDRCESLAKAACNKATTNKDRLAELQSRELEKGAHLRANRVDEHAVDVPDGRLERVTKDGDAYYRLPEHADPLDRSDTTLAYGDLLPIQQLARMDEELRRSTANALPTRLAAKLWNARTDDTTTDNPWERGCKDVAEYVTASDLKHWIRRQEPGTSESYAKKLVSRTIDAALELSTHRLAVHRRTQRKNGLEYTERRLVLPADADVPGEPRAE